MKNKTSQSGSMHLIVIIVLVVVLLAALGFVFWQNFVHKPVIDMKVEETTVVSSEQSAIDDTELTQVATINYGDTTLTINHPLSWEMDKTHVIYDTLTSPDGKVKVRLTLTPPDGLGGSCSSAVQDDGFVTDPIISAEWSGIPGTSKAIFSSHITHYKVSDVHETETYSYGFAAVYNSDDIKNIQTGDSSCMPYAFAGYVDLEDASGAVLQATVVFTDLYTEDLGYQRINLTKAEIETQFASKNAEVAKTIIESIVIK